MDCFRIDLNNASVKNNFAPDHTFSRRSYLPSRKKVCVCVCVSVCLCVCVWMCEKTMGDIPGVKSECRLYIPQHYFRWESKAHDLPVNICRAQCRSSAHWPYGNNFLLGNEVFHFKQDGQLENKQTNKQKTEVGVGGRNWCAHGPICKCANLNPHLILTLTKPTTVGLVAHRSVGTWGWPPFEQSLVHPWKV